MTSFQDVLTKLKEGLTEYVVYCPACGKTHTFGGGVEKHTRKDCASCETQLRFAEFLDEPPIDNSFLFS